MYEILNAIQFANSEIATASEDTMMYSLNESGMLVVFFGLIGVFLVLLLFFATIILMQKIVVRIETKSKGKANPTGK